MNRSDNEFFENYKCLDKICGEIFGYTNGVSEYIRAMEEEHGQLDLRSDWVRDYKQLKHVRWVRNQIAHEAADERISKDDDTRFVLDFYDRIMRQTDPLAVYYQIQQKRADTISKENQPSRSSIIMLVLLILVIVGVAIYALACGLGG